MTRKRGVLPNSQFIKQVRFALGWSQEVAAAKAGVSVKLIRKAENDRPIDLQSLAILVELYSEAGQKVSLADFALLSPDQSENGEDARNAAYLHTWFQQVWVGTNWRTLESLFGDAFLFHCRVGTLQSLDELRKEIESIKAQYVPLNVDIHTQFQRGSLIIGHWRAVLEVVEDIAKPVSKLNSSGVTTFRVLEGKVFEAWEYWHPTPSYSNLAARSGRRSKNSYALPKDIGTPLRWKGLAPHAFLLRTKHLRNLRQKLAWTQEEAAQKAKISLRAYRKAEAGQAVNASTVAAIALGLTSSQQRVTPDELLVDPSEMRYTDRLATELGRRVQAWFDAQWNKPNPDLLDSMATPDFVYHMEHGVIRGPQELKERNRLFRQSFGDINMYAEEIYDFGDALAVRWHCEMTHIGPWLDVPATGCRVVIRGSSWVQLVGDKFGDAWDFWDPSVIYSQLLEADAKQK